MGINRNSYDLIIDFGLGPLEGTLTLYRGANLGFLTNKFRLAQVHESNTSAAETIRANHL